MFFFPWILSLFHIFVFRRIFLLKESILRVPCIFKIHKNHQGYIVFLGKVGPRDLFPLSVNVVVPSYRREERKDVL